MEILLNNHVLYRIHCCLQQRRIGSIRVMDIDLTIGNPVDAPEPVCKVSGCRIEVRVGAIVVREMVGDRRNMQLSLEQIDLVQEQDDRFALEPLAIDQGFEQHHCLMHLVLHIREQWLDQVLSRRRQGKTYGILVHHETLVITR